MKHLNQSDRIKIEHYLNMNYSLRSIAKMLNVSPSMISREIHRNKKDIRANTYDIHVRCKHRKNCNLLITSTAKQCSTSCLNYEIKSCSLFDKKNSSPRIVTSRFSSKINYSLANLSFSNRHSP